MDALLERVHQLTCHPSNESRPSDWTGKYKYQSTSPKISIIGIDFIKMTSTKIQQIGCTVRPAVVTRALQPQQSGQSSSAVTTNSSNSSGGFGRVVSLFSTNLLPSWILIWFLFTAIICTWDASFIMLRPLSLPGGRLSHVWYPYKYYITLDKRYGNIKDSYVYTQSLLNYVEVGLNLYTYYLDKIRSRHTVPLAFTVTVMTFWKTVLYFLMFAEPCGDTLYREGNSATAEFFLVIIPNGVWLVLPFLVLVYLWKHITPKEISKCE